MTRAIKVIVTAALLLTPAFARAQAPEPPAVAAKHGEKIFAATCTGYCHGANGAAGTSAPVLAGRGLDAAYIEKVIMYGVPGTAMAEWGDRMPKPDSAAVIAYVQSLNGIIEVNAGSARDLSPEAQQGRNLFLDSTGDLRGCSNCHQIAGKGIAVAPPIAKVPADVAALRSMATPHVVIATVGGRTFPAIVTTRVRTEVRLYDLSSVPPVMLILAPADAKLTDQSSWQHSTALGTFKDDELAPMLAYLRTMTQP